MEIDLPDVLDAEYVVEIKLRCPANRAEFPPDDLEAAALAVEARATVALLELLGVIGFTRVRVERVPATLRPTSSVGS